MILSSIIGDSISTYEGYNPPNYAVFYDRIHQAINGLTSVYDTWWAKVNQAIHAYLCVNNSYSGSRVTGNTFPAASSIERISELKTVEYSPDIILVYIGVNDFGNGIKIRRKKTVLSRKTDCSFFDEAYGYMIEQIKEQYPRAKVVCGTLLRSRLKTDESWKFPEKYAGVEFEEYNNAIRQIARKKKVFLADVGSYDSRYETLDGTHPTAEGHKTIADAWVKCLAESSVLSPSIETCIKMYYADRSNDDMFHSVFDALLREKVLLPFDSKNNFVGIPYNGNVVIPVYTSPNRISWNESLVFKTVYLQDYTETLLSQKKHLVVNPFSASEMQFFVPYEAINKMFKPIMDGRFSR